MKINENMVKTVFLPTRNVPDDDFGANFGFFYSFCVILRGCCMILNDFTWFWVDFEGKINENEWKTMKNNENSMKITEKSTQIASNRCMPV